MSEESTPGQGLGVWIMSGSLALVMVVGGALAINSGDKRVEEGYPTSTQTVAPGGGHTLGAAEAEDATDLSATNAGAAGVLGVRLTDAGRSGRVRGGEQAVVPVLVGGESIRPLAKAGDQPARARIGSPAPAGKEPKPAAAPTPSQPGTVSETATADRVEVSRSDTGEELQVELAVPLGPGSYALMVSVDGTQFLLHVRVGEDGRVTVPSVDSTTTPYHFDPVTGRLTATLVPADFGSAEAAFAADARIETRATAPDAGISQHVDVDRPVEVPEYGKQDEYAEHDPYVGQLPTGEIGTAAPPAIVEASPPSAAVTPPVAKPSTTELPRAQTEMSSSRTGVTQQGSPQPQPQPELAPPASIETGGQPEQDRTSGGPTVTGTAQPQPTQSRLEPFETGATRSQPAQARLEPTKTGATQSQPGQSQRSEPSRTGTTPSKRDSPVQSTNPTSRGRTTADTGRYTDATESAADASMSAAPTP